MFLTSNSTISVIRNESGLGHENATCIFVDSSAERISKLCAHSVISLGSFFGNIFVILISYKNRDLRKTINYFIVNMALSDLNLTLIVFPVEITSNHLTIAEESPRRHSSKCATTCNEETKTSYKDGGCYRCAFLPLCNSTHFDLFHSTLETFLCHSESSIFCDEFLVLLVCLC